MLVFLKIKYMFSIVFYFPIGTVKNNLKAYFVDESCKTDKSKSLLYYHGIKET